MTFVISFHKCWPIDWKLCFSGSLDMHTMFSAWNRMKYKVLKTSLCLVNTKRPNLCSENICSCSPVSTCRQTSPLKNLNAVCSEWIRYSNMIDTSTMHNLLVYYNNNKVKTFNMILKNYDNLFQILLPVRKQKAVHFTWKQQK